jgi:hypothetical protein
VFGSIECAKVTVQEREKKDKDERCKEKKKQLETIREKEKATRNDGRTG